MRALTVVVAMAVALSSCTFSQVDPDADVSISGRFVGSDGAPLGDRPVGLHVDPGPSILLWVPAIVATLGAACATDICGADHDTATDADGRYAFALRGSDVAGSLGEEVDLLATVEAPPGTDDRSGASGRVRFVARSELIELPEVALWEPAVAIRPDGVAWDPVPVSLPDVERYEALFQTPAGAEVWRSAASDRGLRLDPRVLEDTAGGVAGVASVAVPALDWVHGVELRSGTRRYRSRAGVPASRGGACRVLTDAGEAVALAPCVFTDGDLTTAAGIALPCPRDGTCPVATAVEFELDAERPVELVVVRGCEACRVEAGDATVQLTADAEAIPVAVTTRTVRITGDVTRLREVSVWDAPASGGLEAVAIEVPGDGGATAAPGTAPPAAPTGGGPGRPAWLLLVATLLVGAAGGAVTVALVQRPRRP